MKFSVNGWLGCIGSVGLSLSWVACASWDDQALSDTFVDKQVTFETLAVMVGEDDCLWRLSDSYVAPERECLTDDRTQAYRALLDDVGAFLYRGGEEESCQVYFSLVESGNVTGYDAMGVAYCPTPPENVMPDLAGALDKLAKGQYGYRQVAEGWYLYAVWG